MAWLVVAKMVYVVVEMVEKMVKKMGCFDGKRRKKMVIWWSCGCCCCRNGGGDGGKGGEGVGGREEGEGGWPRREARLHFWVLLALLEVKKNERERKEVFI